ncbi:hypothetical protein HZH68_012246 [Vespula germanica]|uniref:Uncharacterized protein n=1 Tax=Vespula germanica TaxID=30212 RepID=A0A834JJS8_VESGE|nr:hypothetical protein HZH68_012246 [Vespula germanica]
MAMATATATTMATRGNGNVSGKPLPPARLVHEKAQKPLLVAAELEQNIFEESEENALALWTIKVTDIFRRIMGLSRLRILATAKDRTKGERLGVGCNNDNDNDNDDDDDDDDDEGRLD